MGWDSTEDTALLLRDAQNWQELPAGDQEAARAAFAAWLRESPQNVAAFLMDTMLRVELTGLDSAKQFDLDALIATALQEKTGEPSQAPLNPCD